MTVDPSAAPQRERGLHSRAGNAMQRTRAAVLDGAARAVEKHGAKRATMADIAVLAGIAKGTLYNHFRTKEAVYAATLESGVRSLAQECAAVAGEDLAEALALAADRVSSHPALRRVAADEPVALAALATIPDDGIGAVARDGVRDVLVAAGAGADAAAVEVVLRWVASYVASTGSGIDAQAAVLVRALTAPAPVAAPVADPGASDTRS